MNPSARALVTVQMPRLPHPLLLRLRCCRVFLQYFLHLGVRGHVLVHAPVDTCCLTNAELGLLVHGDALAEALLCHPVQVIDNEAQTCRVPGCTIWDNMEKNEQKSAAHTC